MSISSADYKIRTKRPCAILWDESFIWGLMARRALMEAGLPFDLIRSDDIRAVPYSIRTCRTKSVMASGIVPTHK